MCYEERLFRSWEPTKKAQKRENKLPVTKRDRSEVTPIRTARTPEMQRREDVERELEEII